MLRSIRKIASVMTAVAVILSATDCVVTTATTFSPNSDIEATEDIIAPALPDEPPQDLLDSTIFDTSNVPETLPDHESEFGMETDGLLEASLDYSEAAGLIANPESGFYTAQGLYCRREYRMANDPTCNGEFKGLLASAKNRKQTLVGLHVNLKEFAGTENSSEETIHRDDLPVSNECLAQIDRAFDMARESGVKIIFRLMYGWENDDWYPEPQSFDTILTHLDQVGEILAENADILYLVEAGTLGQWGEWHTSKYNTPEYRGAVLNKLLEVVPSDVMINVRTPRFYREQFGESPLDETTGFTGMPMSRIGIHNDAFLGSDTDLGTYPPGEREAELDWLESHTNYTIFGGEMTNMSSTYASFDTAVEEMKRTHCQYLSYLSSNVESDFRKVVYDGENETYQGMSGYEYMRDHLGYRFVLRQSAVPETVVPGDNARFLLEIENTGFSGLSNPREVELVLEQEGYYYTAQIDVDPRSWQAGEKTVLALEFHLPESLKNGQWDVLIRLPDSAQTLKKQPAYSVRFANNGLWDSMLSANFIGSFTVKGEVYSPSDTGFYQVNNENPTWGHEGDPYQLESGIVIDGKQTSPFEWKESSRLYSSEKGDSHIYVTNDRNNLYVFVENESMSEFPYYRLYFSSSDCDNSKYEGKFQFMIENGGGLFASTSKNWAWNWISGSTGQIEAKKSDGGCELKIPLRLLPKLTGAAEFYNIMFEGLDKNWRGVRYISTTAVPEARYRVSGVNPGLLSLKLCMDGIRTTPEEWTKQQLVYEDQATGDQIYAVNDKQFLYIYVQSEKMRQAENFRLFFSNESYNGPRFNNRSHFLIENWSGLLKSTSTAWNWQYINGNSSCPVTIGKSASGCEFQIPLSLIPDSKDRAAISNIEMEILDRQWKMVHRISILRAQNPVFYWIEL